MQPMEAPMMNVLPKTVIASETLAETHFALRNRTVAAKDPMKKLLAGLTAVAVAASLLMASALPSHADKKGDNLAKALAAIIVIGVIANNIDNKNDAKRAPKPLPQPVKLPRVPSVCAIEIDSDAGHPVTMYSESCMREEGFSYRLPNCARSVRIYGQRDRIYSAKCLRDAGFKLSGR
jgi:hypothetical protein